MWPAFYSTRDTLGSIYQKATNGAAEVVPLDTDRSNKRAEDWSRDGRYIIERRPNKANSGFAIWVLPMSGDRKAAPYLQTEFNEQSAKLSPNGQWLAYASDETKRTEIYVQTFPSADGKWQVSTNGGTLPIWSRDGKELFYIGADGKMMAVQIQSGSKLEAGVPKALFATIVVPSQWFDVSKDGRFLMPILMEASRTGITVVVNWTAGLKK